MAVDAKYKRSEPATYTIIIENRNEKLYDEIINNIQVFESILIWQTDTVGSRGLKSAQIHSIRIDGNNLSVLISGDVRRTNEKVFARLKLSTEGFNNPLPKILID